MVEKDIFSFATVTDGCEEANLMGFSMNMAFLTPLLRNFHKKWDFSEKFHEINLLATGSHGCKGENIFCNYDSWLPSRYY